MGKRRGARTFCLADTAPAILRSPRGMVRAGQDNTGLVVDSGRSSSQPGGGRFAARSPGRARTKRGSVRLGTAARRKALENSASQNTERARRMTKIIVDGKEIDVPPEYTLLQACEAAGAEIPRFCFHERLSIAGNCRMCLIEVVGIPKPQASCAMGVKDLPPNKDGSPKILNTKTPMVRQAREGVMELLLINHPLDCPICDQRGECDLQDQAM